MRAMLQSLVDAIVWAGTWLGGIVSVALGWVYDWFVGHLPAGWDLFAVDPWEGRAGVYAALDLVSALFPWQGMIGILGATFVTVGFLRVARWVKNFIPTLTG